MDKNNMAIKRKKAMDNRGKNQVDEAIHNAQNYANVANLNSIFYTGIDPRRRQEMADSHMVAEDNQAMANLSERAIHREYPRISWYTNPFLDAFEI